MSNNSTPFAASPLSRFLDMYLQSLADTNELASVAAAAGYTSSAMFVRFAKGEARVPLDRVLKIANALGVAPSLLIGLGMADHWSYLANVLAVVTASGRRSPVPSGAVEAEETAPHDEAAENIAYAAPSSAKLVAAEEGEGLANLNFKVAPSFHRRFCQEALRRDLFNKELLELAFNRLVEDPDA